MKMTKKYILRQLTLNELGIEVNNDIIGYYNNFIDLLGDINDLKKITHEKYPKSIFYEKQNKTILRYQSEKNIYFVHADFFSKFCLNNYDIKIKQREVFYCAFLEYYFKEIVEKAHVSHILTMSCS